MNKPFPTQGRTKSPCFGCTERREACHAECRRYLEFKDIHTEEVNQIRENKKKSVIGKVYWRDQKSFKNAGKKGKNKVFKQSMR